jgi:hypothetical protein
MSTGNTKAFVETQINESAVSISKPALICMHSLPPKTAGKIRL